MSSPARIALAFALVVAPVAASGQVANLLKDIQESNDSGGSEPLFLGSASGIAYFSAETPGIGRELWSTDGTPEQTRLVGDLCPLDCSSHFVALGSAGGRLFLSRSNYEGGSSARELLSITGSPAQVTSIAGALEFDDVRHLAAPENSRLLGSSLLFSYRYAPQSTGLFASDGSPGDLRLLKAFTTEEIAYGLQRIGSEVVFWRRGEFGGSELWRTNGTPGGTLLVGQLEIEASSQSVVLPSGKIIFVARSEEGTELWSTNGSLQETRRLTSFPEPNVEIGEMLAGSELAFVAVKDTTFGQEIWATNGSPGGTFAATSFGYHEPFGSVLQDISLAVAGNQAYFFAYDGFSLTSLWASGTGPESAHHVLDLCNGYCWEDFLEAVGNRVLFVREDASTGSEVWVSDGTANGSHLLFDACAGPCSGSGQLIAKDEHQIVYLASVIGAGRPTFLVASPPWTSATVLYDETRAGPVIHSYQAGPGLIDGSRIYFKASDSGFGLEPWTSAGSSQNTYLLADIVGVENSSPDARNFVSNGGSVAFFAGTLNEFNQAWVTHGDWDSTRSIPGGSSYCSYYIPTVQPAGDFFVRFGCSGEIDRIDPNAYSSTPLAQDASIRSVSATGTYRGSAVALFDNDQYRQELWRSDGTSSGTHRTYEFSADESVDGRLVEVNQTLVLSHQPDYRLYAASASLNSITPISPPGVLPYFPLTPTNEPLAFFSTDEEIWRTNGSASGTLPLSLPGDRHFLHAATRSADGYDLLVGDLFDSTQIWRSDGTSAGSTIRATIQSGGGSNSSLPMIRIGNRLQFIHRGVEGRTQLWVLEDSASEASELVSPGNADFYVPEYELARVGARVLFTGCEPTHGCEPWISDGTEAGTRLLQDIYPGPSSSNASRFVPADGYVLFSADDGLHGFELWTVRDTVASCEPTTRTLCLEDSRFQVAASWRDFAGNSGDATAVPLSSDTGYFWFFDDQNVEMILKVLDGTGTNGHHWVYYGALTNVEYSVTITDSDTGAAKRYFNPATRFASSGDIYAFGPQGAHASGPVDPNRLFEETVAGTPPLTSMLSPLAGASGTCTPTDTRFCILDGRFAVEATWRDFVGHTGVAHASTLTDDTGYLWFFDESNVEVVLKAVDGSDFNGHYWIYYGALSNVEYTVTVTDTVAGTSRQYRNLLGKFGSFGDIEAFPAP